jgi:hypothetical protein
MTHASQRGLAAQFLPMAAIVGVFVAGPLIVGSSPSAYVFFAIGSAYSVFLLMRIARGDRWAVAVLPMLLAVELVVAGLVQQLGKGGGDLGDEIGGRGLGSSFLAYHAPSIDPSLYLAPGAIGRVLIDSRGDYGRYLSFDPRTSLQLRGFLTRPSPRYWPAYENGRSIVFGIYEVQGYSPVQLDRYWRLVRRVSTRPVYYNEGTFQSIDPQVLKLLGVEWLILPEGTPPPDLAIPIPVASEGTWKLYRLSKPEPRASVVFTAQMATSGSALDTVLSPGFDPSKQAVVESSVAGLPPLAGDGQGTARYSELSSQHVRVTTIASGQGLLVVRNVFDDHWHATVDGRSVPLYLTDYLLQGIAVPPGRHVIDLTYHDGAIGEGLAISGVAWGALALTAAWFWLRRRRREPEPVTVVDSVPPA